MRMWRLKKPDQNICRNTTESIVLDEAITNRTLASQGFAGHLRVTVHNLVLSTENGGVICDQWGQKRIQLPKIF